jgi:hypothetical protein
MSTEEFPSLRFVLTSTVSKLGLSIAPIPDEINELVALVILLMSDDLICSESSALTPKENPIDMVKIELSNIFDKLELEILIILIIKFKKFILIE